MSAIIFCHFMDPQNKQNSCKRCVYKENERKERNKNINRKRPFEFKDEVENQDRTQTLESYIAL